MSVSVRDRNEWLRSIYEFTIKHDRGPTAVEMATMHGTSRQNQQQRLNNSVADGWVVELSSRGTFFPAVARLTAVARIEIGVPMVTYLAWPIITRIDGSWAQVDDGGVDAASWLKGATGIAAVSPFSSVEWPAPSMEIAALLAERCDAVVVVDDPLLVGRPDVAAALRAGLSISVVRRFERNAVSCMRDLWMPPLLLPPGK